MLAETLRHGRLTRRSEFLEAAKGLRVNARAFSLQAATRASPGEARFGFTATKKTGNAVERARMRRRLKEAIRTTKGLPVRDGHDYVFVARREALSLPFAELSAEIARALAEIGKKLERKSREPKKSETGQFSDESR
ncbi:MAG: ribonuclease P protein component [Beijerinckiaceae bacterium]